MDYANNVSQRDRLRYLRGLADVEACWSPVPEDECVKMLAGEGRGQEDEAFLPGVLREPITRGHKNLKTRTLARRVQSDLEDDTPAEPAAFEDQGVLPIEASDPSWCPPSARLAPPGLKRNATVVSHKEKRSESPDLGWPPVNQLFADLPEPVTPVFRKEALSSPVQTIWNRRKQRRVLPHYPVEDLNQPWLSQGRRTEEPEEFVSKAPSVSSSANDNLPPDLLKELKLEDSKLEDPSIFINHAFAPVLAFLHQEWKTTRLLHRHLRSTLRDSTTVSPPSATKPGSVLTQEKREIQTSLINECRHHIHELKECYRNTEKLMELTMQATQSAASFRLGVEDGDADEVIKEMLKPEREDKGRKEYAYGLGDKRALR